MASPQHEQTADRAELLYQWALSEIALGVTAQSFDLFSDSISQTGATRATARTWKEAARRLIDVRQPWIADLAIAYYRLVRALRTGSTVPGLTPDPEPPTIESLMDDLEEIVDEIERHRGVAARPVERTPQRSQRRSTPQTTPSTPEPVNAPQIVLEVVENDPLEIDEDVDASWEDLIEELDRETDEQIDAILEEITVGRIEREAEKRREEEDHKKAEAEAQETWKKARRRAAAEADRISRLFARGITYRFAKGDPKAIGWVRLHDETAPDDAPCPWCAMLISRGAVYKQRTAVTVTEGSQQEVGEKFHTNCHCLAVPVFSEQQYETSDLFNRNREFAQLWADMRDGKVGDYKPGEEDILTAWRRLIRERYPQSESDSTAQQAAPEAA